ncbi:MAG: hypothetical protein KJ566_00840 [Nanoarchaeota archaeon]|nr:hypothetical protein [Nanoarchaeota archaeon]
MEKITKANVHNTGLGNKIIFHLLQDYQTQTSLTNLIYPKYTQQKVHPNIQYYFSIFKGAGVLEEKEIYSSSTIRKGNSQPYKIKVKGYRLKIKEFIQKYTYFKFSNRSLKILETLFYPKNIRNLAFNEKSFNKKEGNLLSIFFEFVAYYFILDYIPKLIKQELKDFEGNRDERSSVVKFDKKINRERTPEELSKSIFLRISAGTPLLGYSSYFYVFVEEKFILDLIMGFNNSILVRGIENELKNLCIRQEHDIEMSLQEEITHKGYKQKKSNKKYDPDSALGWVGVFDKMRSDKFFKLLQKFKKRKLKNPRWETSFKHLERTNQLYDKVRNIEEKIKQKIEDGFYFVEDISFTPKAKQKEEKGYNKLIIPKI